MPGVLTSDMFPVVGDVPLEEEEAKWIVRSMEVRHVEDAGDHWLPRVAPLAFVFVKPDLVFD